MSKDDYTRGRSGYSVGDEKRAKKYGQQDYKESRGSPMPQREREYRRDIGGPYNYLHNTKTERGREINKKNEEFMSDENIRKRKNEAAAAGKVRLTTDDKKY